MVYGFGDADARLVGRTLAAGPNVRWTFDFTDILTELCDGSLPKHPVAAFIQKVLAVLGEWLLKLLGSHLPHLFHGILPFLTELEAGGPFIQSGKQTSDYALHFDTGKHSHARLHNEIFMEEKDFRTDARLIRRGIVGTCQLFERLARRSLQ